jgi:MscS family membrane protein
MKIKLLLVLTLALVAAVAAIGGEADAILAQSGTPEPAEPAAGEAPAPTATGLLDEIVVTRAPEPTATPGRLEQQVDQLVRSAGLTRTTFLGVSVADWINLGISLVWVLAGYLIGTWLIRSILPRLARRTPTEFDDRFLVLVGSDIRWLVVLIILYFATTRLTFVSIALKTLLNDVYFVVGLFLLARIVFRLINLGGEWSRERAVQQGREGQLEPLILLLSRVSRVVTVLVALIVLLSYFGINVSAFAAALGLGGLAISLAAQDTIADAIAGFIILVDQPFRIGDRVEIQEEGTWGDVVDIGLRTTRIRTRDNRMVIVPNSVIGKSQVINYTYPDPRYRIETNVGIAYGTDIETARQVIVDAIRKIEGVLLDRPVDALYVEMGDSAMLFRVRWWIESYRDTRRMFDKVNTALQHALDEAGIESPFPTQTLNLHFDQQAQERMTPGDRQ